MSPLTEAHLCKVLEHNFGHKLFRPSQLQAIQATLSGLDSLLVLPTGGGKSITFQLPALALDNCFTVVISPLIALARDQVDKCMELGIEAQIWNCEVGEQQKKMILSEIISDCPELRLLYTTPESLRNSTLFEYVKEAYANGTLCSFAIDEAHCVSDWGHDFRPAYLELSRLRAEFPKTPIAAVTASCTDQVQTSILSCLNLSNPVVLKASFNRPNLQYQVRYKELIGDGTDESVMKDIVEFIKYHEGQCGIIYARLRATCDWLTSILSNHDLDASCYHAGKDPQQRRRVQTDWSSGDLQIVVATIAFGMGIDRADVRAGRDGQPSLSVLYLGHKDLDTITKLEKGVRKGAIQHVAEYACQPGCRRRKVLSYFGEKRHACNATCELACDYCGDPKSVGHALVEWEGRVEANAQAEANKDQQQDEDQQREGENADSESAHPAPSKRRAGDAWCVAAALTQQHSTQRHHAGVSARLPVPSDAGLNTPGMLSDCTNLSGTVASCHLDAPHQHAGPAVVPQLKKRRQQQAAFRPPGFAAPKTDDGDKQHVTASAACGTTGLDHDAGADTATASTCHQVQQHTSDGCAASSKPAASISRSQLSTIRRGFVPPRRK
eukprot:jgi/Chrzof1/448/Cz01g16070.t1